MFSEEVLRRATGYSYAREVGTRRGAQDLVYRMFAVAVLEHYCEAYPEEAETLGWLLWPKRRHALLTVGRVVPRSDRSGNLRWSEDDVSRLMEAAFFGRGKALYETRSADDAGLSTTHATLSFERRGSKRGPDEDADA